MIASGLMTGRGVSIVVVDAKTGAIRDDEEG
jgi:hypothetical protein